MRHKKLTISSLMILALASFSFAGYLKFKINPAQAHNDTTIHEVLPTIHSKYQGCYYYNLSDDDINQVLHITKHHLYLQSGTGLTNTDKNHYIKHLRNQDKKQSDKNLNKSWNSYVKENQKNGNQTHLALTVHKIINDKNKIILTGYNQNYTPKRITLYTKHNNIFIHSNTSDKATYGLVKSMKFNSVSNKKARTVLSHDKLNSTLVDL